jgi:hypothetical protein
MPEEVMRPRRMRERAIRRPLRIFSSDPMIRSPERFGSPTTIDLPYEPLKPGPQGSRIEVIDYDAEHNRFYPPVDLNDSLVLLQGGREPDESDPGFHQQMVYAVTMKVLENFETALGRRIPLCRNNRRLRIFPHAFHGANAFYDGQLHALLFGYFRADRSDPGHNLPGQVIFTCLSHDIIAHEMTHALVHDLRPYFFEPSNQDVLAFHEGFADIVALFQHFTYEDILRDAIQRGRTNLRTPDVLVELARQYGAAVGSGKALRSALDQPNKTLYQTVSEPHERGAILVAAVFDAFFSTYQNRIRDLIRLATNGTGNLPDADLHPDLVNRAAAEATSTAEIVLRMCIRAFDYLPPVDVTFGDYLRALITADYELNPVDNLGLRASVIEAFRARGIYPEDVPSLAEESLLWEDARDLDKLPTDLLGELTLAGGTFYRDDSGPSAAVGAEEKTNLDLKRKMHELLLPYLEKNAGRLALEQGPGGPPWLESFHTVFRVGRDGQLRIELVAQFCQRAESLERETGKLQVLGGTTLVAAADGTVRYAIFKPLPSQKIEPRHEKAALTRMARMQEFVRHCELADPRFAWGAQDYRGYFMMRLKSLAAVHQGV